MSGFVSSEASRVQYRRSILEAISGQRFNFLVLGRPRYVSTNSVEAAMTERRQLGAIETVTWPGKTQIVGPKAAQNSSVERNRSSWPTAVRSSRREAQEARMLD